MRNKFLTRTRIILAVFGILLVFTLIFSSFSFIMAYEKELESRAEEIVSSKMSDSISEYNKTVDSLLDEARMVSEKASMEPTEEKFRYFLEGLVTADGMGDMSPYFKKAGYIKGEKLLTASGSEYISTGDLKTKVIETFNTSKSIAFSGIYKDINENMNLACIVIPYEHAGIYDGIVLYYEPALFKEVTFEDTDKQATFLAVIRKDGTLVSQVKECSFIDSSNVKSSLTSVVIDATESANLSSLFMFSQTDRIGVKIDNEKYIVATSSIGNSNVYLFGMYKSADMIASEYSFYRTLFGLFMLFGGLSVGLIIFIVVRYVYQKYYSKDDTTSKVYMCLTQTGFVKEASEIHTQHSGSSFAVVIAQIRFYKYILSLGGGLDKSIVLSLRNFFKKMMREREIYGYDGNGKFYLLLYYKDAEEFKKRLKVVDEYCNRIKIDDEKHLMLFYGVSITEKKEDILTTIEHAKESLKSTEEKIGIMNLNIYDRSSDEEHLDKEYIEMNVERALQNGDFKVFYQPKYNIKKNMIDGAEALVRWYMPKEKRFYPPMSFLPIIEANGFISKIDRSVYEQVCIYIRQSLDRGERVYPVSVNVSAVTLAQDDFVDYYVALKKKYKIRDGLLTVELTESTSFDNYDRISNIIERLHANGFMCSIDDFGTGFSSYNCLKSLQIDEIKLDRFFLGQGLSEERDRSIIKSVIDLGRKLKMKVTVEGVSDSEQFNMLEELDCDVIQGYLYSKPIPLADYISFTNSKLGGSFH